MKLNKKEEIRNTFMPNRNYEIVTADNYWGIVYVTGSQNQICSDWANLDEFGRQAPSMMWAKGPRHIAHPGVLGAEQGKFSVTSVANRDTIVRNHPDTNSGFSKYPATKNVYTSPKSHARSVSVSTAVAHDPEDKLDYSDLYWKYVYAPADVTNMYLEKMLSRVTLDMQPEPYFSTWVTKPDPYAMKKVNSRGKEVKTHTGFLEAYEQMSFLPRFWIVMSFLTTLIVILHTLVMII